MKLKYSAKAHGYWLDGKRCKSPSAIAKVPDDSSALDKWRRRQTAIGLAMRPELLTEIAASVEDKQAIDAICERAMDHAGASSGRNWGSAVHLIIERDISGATILETPETARVRAQWQRLLDQHRLRVVRAEAVIVHPELMITGRFDQVMESVDTGDLFVMDVKTGASADQYLHAHAVQLWLYASAPLMATGPQGDTDFEVTEFEPMLPVSQSVAFVAHIPQDGEPSLIPVDIAAGGECFRNVIQPTWAWRARKDLRADWTPTKAPPALTITAERGPKFTTAEALTEAVLNYARPDPHAHGKAFNAVAVAVTTAPDEGPEVDLTALRARYAAANTDHLRWIAGIRADAVGAGVDIHLKDAPTMRRARIMDGLLTLVEADCHDDDAVRALVREATGDDAVEWPTIAVGVAVGSMGAAEADAFAAACEMFVGGRYGLVVGDGGPRLVAA